MNPFLKTRREGAVLLITMDEPQTRNALTGNSAAEEFVRQCETIALDPSIRAVVLTGEGACFSSGGNVKDMKKYFTDKPSPFRIREEYRHGIQRIPKALFNLEVPTIAAVNGAAIGAGMDLACMCDIRIASKNATFAESFVKVGIVPGDGGAWLLPRIVGMSKAAQLAFSGDVLSAEEAVRCGLISELAERDQLLETAMNLAHRIAANPGEVVRMTKRLLREGQHMSLESLLELSASYQAIAHYGADHEEAVRAFIEKRPAVFNRG